MIFRRGNRLNSFVNRLFANKTNRVVHVKHPSLVSVKDPIRECIRCDVINHSVRPVGIVL